VNYQSSSSSTLSHQSNKSKSKAIGVQNNYLYWSNDNKNQIDQHASQPSKQTVLQNSSSNQMLSADAKVNKKQYKQQRKSIGPTRKHNQDIQVIPPTELSAANNEPTTIVPTSVAQNFVSLHASANQKSVKNEVKPSPKND
jgi:hypothetical protein